MINPAIVYFASYLYLKTKYKCKNNCIHYRWLVVNSKKFEWNPRLLFCLFTFFFLPYILVSFGPIVFSLGGTEDIDKPVSIAGSPSRQVATSERWESVSTGPRCYLITFLAFGFLLVTGFSDTGWAQDGSSGD